MPPHPTVLFVCLHGAAKSVIAAHHLARLAADLRIDVRTAAAGIEPDATIPPHVVAGLVADGLAPPESAPQEATAALLASADWIISFGCDVDGAATRAMVTRWDDVPAVSDGYAPARDAIVSRLTAVLDTLTRLDPTVPLTDHN